MTENRTEMFCFAVSLTGREMRNAFCGYPWGLCRGVCGKIRRRSVRYGRIVGSVCFCFDAANFNGVRRAVKQKSVGTGLAHVKRLLSYADNV